MIRTLIIAQVHGFRPNGRAERQGLIKVNDEILEINSIDVEGQVSLHIT